MIVCFVREFVVENFLQELMVMRSRVLEKFEVVLYVRQESGSSVFLRVSDCVEKFSCDNAWQIPDFESSYP